MSAPFDSAKRNSDSPASSRPADARGDAASIVDPPAVFGACAAGPGNGPDMEVRMTRFLASMAALKASDLIFIVDAPPMCRVNGRWTPMVENPVHVGDITEWLHDTLTAPQEEWFATRREINFAIDEPGVGRFRVNAHYQKHTPAIAIRAIPEKPPQLDDLGLPDEVQQLTRQPGGLVIITGGAGDGRSTIIAALIEALNRTEARHIITLEQPIEFTFAHGKCLIEQREVGFDTPSFADGLISAARHRADVLVVADLPDTRAIAAALAAAETGTLVFAGMTSGNTGGALSHIIDTFPPEQQPFIRGQVASTLRAILCTRLMPTRDGGVAPAVELLFAVDAVRRAIRDNDRHLIYGLVETGRNSGMRTMERSLADLVMNGAVDMNVARHAAPQVERFDRLLIAGRAAPHGDDAPTAAAPGPRPERPRPIQIRSNS